MVGIRKAFFRWHGMNMISSMIRMLCWGGGKNSVSPIPYDICGYRGEKVFIEDRYNRVFEGNDKEVAYAPWEWFFGCSAAPLDAMLKINGWDQRFDGDRMLGDVYKRQILQI